MRGLIPLTAFLFAAHIGFAQLTVKPSNNGRDNFVYVKEVVLYVANDLNLVKNSGPETEASIYLRRNAPLIQGVSQQKENSGTGLLSVFQEGSTNAFDYNYWSSPVGKPGSQKGLFGIPFLHSPVNKTKSLPAQITPGLNGLATPLTISNKWIYTFSGKEYSSWNYVGGTISIPPGYGFTMKGVDGKDPTEVEGVENNPGREQRYDFRGLPYSGDIEVPVAPGEIVLVGNPYPSSLDLSLFLVENSGDGTLQTSCYGDIDRRNATTGIAYFWDSKENGNSHYLYDYEGGYGAFSPVDPCTNGIYEKPLLKTYGPVDRSSGAYGKHYDRRYLPIAQGFMVEGTNGLPVKFRNAQRYFPVRSKGNQSPVAERKTANIEKEVTVLPKIRIQVSFDEQYVRSMSLAFWPAATAQVDHAMDAPAYDQAPSDAGWLHHDTNYSIDVRPFEVSDQIPLFLKVENKETEISFYHVAEENIGIKNILILDSETNTYYDISDSAFNINLQPGNYNGRFRLAFSEVADLVLLPGEPVITEEDAAEFSVFQNNLMQELEIISDSGFPVRSVGVFDLQGKKLYFRSNFTNRRSIGISTQHWAPGIYLVKVNDSEGKQTTKKISVYKR